MRLHASLFLALLVASCGIPAAAMAATVDVSPLILWIKPWLDAAASAVVTAIVAMIAVWAKRWFGIELEARDREALHSALTTGAQAAFAKAADLAASKLSRVEIENMMVAETVSYALRAAPDAIRRFAVADPHLAEMARAKLVQVAPALDLTRLPSLNAPAAA